MNARHVQVRGCLPTLIVLVVVGAALAFAVTASFAFLALAVAAGLIAAAVRWARRIAGGEKKAAPAARRAADATIDAELVEPPEGVGDRPPKRLE